MCGGGWGVPHAGEFGDPFGDGVFEGELAFVAQFENGERCEALRHRRDAEDGVGGGGGLGGAVLDAGGANVGKFAIDDDAPDDAGDLFGGGVAAEEFIDFGEGGLELGGALWVGEGGGRVGVVGKESGGVEKGEGAHFYTMARAW